MKVPFLDLPLQHAGLKAEILSAWSELLDKAAFIGGDVVERFEESFARACGTKYCVSVSSGTDALRFIFMALKVKPGDEIITVPNTFIATTEAITQAGGKIVFCDIDKRTYNIDVNQIEQLITPRTVGIVPVHLYGQPADMKELSHIAQKHNLWLVEDSCQAHLAKYNNQRVGSIGNAGAFSFYPGKNLGACGEAGAVTTNDITLAQTIRALRNHGQSSKYIHELEGYNGRCDALQAAALQIKMPYLEGWCQKRRENADKYSKLLNDLPVITPKIAADRTHVFHLYVICVENRREIINHLTSNGIATGLHYPLPLHTQKPYENNGYTKGQFPITENVSQQLLSLPMYPELTDEQINYVCEKLSEIL